MSTSDLKTAQILVVDTSTLTRQILARTLREELHNILVTEAESGEEALEKLEQQSFNLVTTSLMLSDMDGLALTRQIRNSTKHHYTPLIVVSGDADSRLLREGFEAGVTDYFDKSNGYKAFGTFIKSFLSRNTGLSGHILFVEDSKTSTMVTGKILDKHGLTFTHTTSAEEAYKMLEAQHEHPDESSQFDMVLTDFYTLGDMTGGDLLHAIRAKFHYSQQELPVLVLTSADDHNTQVEIFHAGGNDFVVKPIIEEIFLARVRALLLIKHQFDALKMQTDAIRWIAATDSLTGVRSRRYLVDHGEEILTDPANQPVWGIIIDIDHFKVINDTHGHINGDHVLAALGATLNKAFPDDTVVRFGGEEFCALISNLTEDEMLQKAEILRQEIEVLNPVGVNVSISAGIASSLEHPDLSLSEFIACADEALYKAKDLGRNRVCINKDDGLHLSPYQNIAQKAQNINN